MDKLIDGILLTGVREINIRESIGYVENYEDIEDYEDIDGSVLDPIIDPNYPTTEELDNIDSFLSHFDGFKHKVSDEIPLTDVIALYAVYMNHGSC